jgi:hypothetical protein
VQVPEDQANKWPRPDPLSISPFPSVTPFFPISDRHSPRVPADTAHKPLDRVPQYACDCNAPDSRLAGRSKLMCAQTMMRDGKAVASRLAHLRHVSACERYVHQSEGPLCPYSLHVQPMTAAVRHRQRYAALIITT